MISYVIFHYSEVLNYFKLVNNTSYYPKSHVKPKKNSSKFHAKLNLHQIIYVLSIK